MNFHRVFGEAVCYQASGSVRRHGLVACPLCCVCTVSVGQVYSGKCYEYDAIAHCEEYPRLRLRLRFAFGFRFSSLSWRLA